MKRTSHLPLCLLAPLLLCCSDSRAGRPEAAAADGGDAAIPDGGSAAIPDGADASAADGGGHAGLSACRGSVDDLAVSTVDALGYPSFALSRCSLVYIATDGSLRLRSLDRGDEEELAPAHERPTRPSIAGSDARADELIAWESARDSAVRVRYRGVTESLRTDYARSGQPRVCADAVVFSAWVDGGSAADADIVLYEPATRAFSKIAEGPGQQLFPDVSPSHVAYSDFAEDEDGRFDDDGEDLANVVLVRRATGERRELTLAGKQAFPLLLDGGQLVYLSWVRGTHPEPKLSAYALMAWDLAAEDPTLLADIETYPPYVRPSSYGDTVEWIVRPLSGDERLMRMRVRADTTPQLAFSQPKLALHATASTRDATVLATIEAEQTTPKLRAVAR
jgi:hypothetical protein